ncbi:MAG TPA: hypothetical protein VHX63_07235 [Acidobacteriaceae bacterium]|jgi:hypothetical protein|nr:hypothetical protein [Acidobacteriaceae bacterium]
MSKKIMIVGLGDLGAVLVELLLRLPEDLEIVVAARNVEKATMRCNLARLGALAQECASTVRLIQLDLNHLEATAEAIHREQPAILLSTATLSTWWLPDLLPPQDAQAIRRAGFGVWLPVHLAPTLQLMRAVRQAQYSGFVLTAPYPDVVNNVLGKVGLAPTCGIGNIAEMVPKVRLRAAQELGVPVAQVRAVFVAHHALGKYVYSNTDPNPEEPVPPFLLRIESDGHDVTDRLDSRQLVLSPEPIPEGRVMHLLTAGSTIPLMRALLQSAPVFLHTPAPNGLPGGYPVHASQSGVKLALGSIPIAEAITVNEQSQVYDGISQVLEDGTVVLAEDRAQQLQNVLGMCPRRIAISDVEAQAKDLVSRFQTYATRRGVKLL